MPWPKLVIAVGACAISGGPYVDHPEVHNGAARSAAGRSLHSRLPAAPADHSRRIAGAAATRWDRPNGLPAYVVLRRKVKAIYSR